MNRGVDSSRLKNCFPFFEDFIPDAPGRDVQFTASLRYWDHG